MKVEVKNFNETNTYNQKNIIASKIPFLTSRNNRKNNKNADIIFLDNNIGININTMDLMQKEDKLRKYSIGVNTSEQSENKKGNKQKIISFKPKIYYTKPYSDLFKKYIIAYDENNKIKKQEPTKEMKIPKLKIKKKFSAVSVLQNKKFKRNDNKRIIKIKDKNKESLLTYNFVKDAYSEEQRLLLSIPNNNFEKRNNNKMRKVKTSKNFRTMIYSNEDLKSMSSKGKKNKKFKLFNKTNLFHENPNYNQLFEHSVHKDIKNSFCNSLLRDILGNNEQYKKGKEEEKIVKKQELIKLMEYPDSIFNYILLKLKEYNSFQNIRNGFRVKLENMKTDLKITEQKALYQLINLKYERVPGDEINIKTNLFCIKNKNNLHL